MPRRKKHPRGKRSGDEGSASVASPPRIVGGAFRGRKLLYSGDRGVRPMKQRVREAIFNLVGPAIRGKHALDLFAGTGALGLEALSRDAARATFLERHFPTAELIRRNAESLGVADRCTILTTDTFFWLREPHDLGPEPWVVFVSPPYDFYVNRTDDMLALIRQMIDEAPPASRIVVESDQRFDAARLPEPGRWDVRQYPPAQVGLLVLPDETENHPE